MTGDNASPSGKDDEHEAHLEILLCAALTAAICIPVLADVPATSSGLVATSAILSATEHSGETDVTVDLLDGNTATAWVRTSAAAPTCPHAQRRQASAKSGFAAATAANQNYYNEAMTGPRPSP